MPRYEVIEPGFINDTLHKPGHPRHGIVITEKELKPVPSWLKPMSKETAAQRKKRQVEEAKQAKVDAEKQKQDKVDVDAVTFTESVPESSVETLG